jgi:Ser/Thr protein kinase RdoA (MazF antagonist)
MSAHIPEWLGFTPPNFDKDLIKSQLWNDYRLEGKLESLDGEREQNFRLKTSNDQIYLIRISHLNEDSNMLDHHARVLDQLNKTTLLAAVPKIIKTSTGSDKTYLHGTNNTLRVFSYIIGNTLSGGDVSNPDLASNAGRLLGQITQCLTTLQNSNAPYFMSWDMTNGLISQELLWTSAGPDLLSYRSGILKDVCLPALEAIKSFETTFVHNDAHLNNLLRVNNDDSKISGLIDFGDAMVTHPICDLAIICMGFAESSQSPERSVAAAAAGYHEQYPFTVNELDLLWPLVITRELFSVLLFDYKIYHDVSASPNVRETRPHMAENLINLLQLNADSIRDAVFDTCKI